MARHFATGGASGGEVPPGVSLRERLAGRRSSPEAALVLVHPVVEALARLHAAGRAHGAVTLDTVLVTPAGEVRLGGAVSGNAGADVAAVGALLCALIVGPPSSARGGSGGSLRARDRRVCPELDRLVAACLAPSKRPRDAGVLLARLSSLLPCPLEHLDAERARLLADPEGWQRGSAERAAIRAMREAERALAAGDELGALGAIERMLAHRPEDPALLALRSAAEPSAPPEAPELRLTPTLPAWTHGLAAALGTGLLLAAAVGGVMWMAIEDEGGLREAPPVSRTLALAASTEAVPPLGIASERADLQRERCLAPDGLPPGAALAACDAALAHAPGDAALFAARASHRAAAGQLASALADLTRAIDLAPPAPAHHYTRALLRKRLGDERGAHRDLRAACASAHELACRALAARAPP